MMDVLAEWLARYREDPKGFASGLKVPVLWVEHLPPADPEDGEEEDERSLHTSSGIGKNPLKVEPRLATIQKNKENAFQRGVTVGRTPNNDLVIDDGSVSRFHAWFFQNEEGAWAVMDAGSKNGTFVSVKKLLPKKAQVLQGGEKLRFGHVDAWFLTPPKLVERLRRRAG